MMDDTTKGFVQAVKRMRELQKRFFEGQKELLAPAKRAEKVVDALIDDMIGDQQAKLF